MVAPFANFSVAGWTWYQGENNVYGDMVRIRIHSPHEPHQCMSQKSEPDCQCRVQGNSKDGTGYGCSLPAMINLWRSIWTGAAHDALFGVATLAAGGSEGPGWHMSGDPLAIFYLPLLSV